MSHLISSSVNRSAGVFLLSDKKFIVRERDRDALSLTFLGCIVDVGDETFQLRWLFTLLQLLDLFLEHNDIVPDLSKIPFKDLNPVQLYSSLFETLYSSESPQTLTLRFHYV
jgi:hypothetical protein